MTNAYERRCLIEAAQRVALAFPARGAVAAELSSWLEEQDLGVDWAPELDHFRARGIPLPIWEELRARLAGLAGAAPRARPDALARNAAALAAHMRLNEDEARIFALAVRAARNGPMRSLCGALIGDARLPVEDAAAHLTGLPPRRVRKALAPAGRLAASGLLRFETPPASGLGLPLADRLLRALEPPSRGLSDVLARLFDAVPAPSATWEDFEHLGPGRDFALRLLKGALARRRRGVNVLLHGAPGTGKTEFCKLLATRLGASLQAVGEADDDGDEPTRLERLQQLRLGQRLLADRRDALILFDEMEDLLPGLEDTLFGLVPRRAGSKVHMNRLLENNPVPTLWTTNAVSACDPAFLRRISFTLELRTPPAEVRARTWRRLARRHRVALPRDVSLELAHRHDDAPALADGALRATRIAGGGVEDLRLAAAAISRAVRGGRAAAAGTRATLFDPALVNADHDLGRLVARLVARGPAGAGGLCLSGAPGTGKSAFARHLAERMRMPALERRASDLLDRYVGGSERNIADAFAEARDTGAFLIFDEADSLLGAREGAAHRWEVSQVNEMLTWMESHPLPFACTTNHADVLDPATARRFTLRIRFLPLDAAQRAACFRRFFALEPPAALRGLDRLTPGDFAVVARRAALLGEMEPAAILAELRREHAAKPDAHEPIGFRAAG